MFDAGCFRLKDLFPEQQTKQGELQHDGLSLSLWMTGSLSCSLATQLSLRFKYKGHVCKESFT